MERQAVIKAGREMIYLASCALHGRIPGRDELANMSLKEVAWLAKFHSMESIVYICLAKCVKEYGADAVDAGILARLGTAYHVTMQRLVMFDIEREEFCRFMSERGWYLCLKGVVLQNYYPTLGMRQMADNDILVDVKHCPAIKDYFLSRGYEAEEYGVGCHDSYKRAPLNFEIHHKLFMEVARTRLGHDYYRDVKSRLIPGERPGELVFTDDDFYVYFLYHAYKHYSGGGSGVRTLMDIFVYCSKKADLDKKYIARQLALLGISDYADSSYRLAFLLFSPEARPTDVLDGKMADMLEYYLTSGTFGTQERMVENSLADMADGGEITGRTKLKYIFRRLFPDMSYYNSAYPRASRLFITIPILWLHRLMRGIKNSDTHRNEIKHVTKK